MGQRRRRLVSIVAVMAAMLLVSGAAVAVRRVGGGREVAAPSPARQRQRPPPPDPVAVAEPVAVPRPVVPAPGSQARIDVAVATLWIEPGQARPIDAPSLTNPVDASAWVSTMTVADKRWLVGRLATQALDGDRVVVIDQRGNWTRVAVVDQPSSLDARGYPGWLPTAQLNWRTSGPPAADDPAPAPGVGPSLGEDLVKSAQELTGIPYLWAGVSPLGFDCSGLTWAVYRAHGIVIPRDTADQAGMGVPVDRAELAPGDLLFYASGPGQDTIHHVAMYAGNGTMVQSPATGKAVETVAVDAPEWAGQFWGARRLLAS